LTTSHLFIGAVRPSVRCWRWRRLALHRSLPEPVAALFLQNLVAYYSLAAASEPPHPFFERGHVISWGTNYSSERGVAAR
jgi:hypothetical protein